MIGDDPQSIVLWVTLSGAQAEDDVQRLEPFCMLPIGWRPDDLSDDAVSIIEGFEELELEGAILLSGRQRRRMVSRSQD